MLIKTSPKIQVDRAKRTNPPRTLYQANNEIKKLEEAKAQSLSERRVFSIIIKKTPAENAIDCAEFLARGKIRSGNKFIPFQLFPYQIAIIEGIEGHKTSCFTKVRQVGATELLGTGYFVWKAMRDPSYLAACFSLTQPDSSEIALRCRQFIASHPDLTLTTDSKKDLVIKNGGRILFRPTTENAGRGLPSVHDLLFDECSFVPKIKDISGNASGGNAMVEDAKIIFCSTPNGKSGYHYEILNSNNGDVDFLKEVAKLRNHEPCDITGFRDWTDCEGAYKALIHWTAHPKYSLETDYLERVKRDKKLTEATLQREYNLGYNDSDAEVFGHTDVDVCGNGSLEAPRPRARYIMGIDPNAGGDDDFVTQVWDITNSPYKLVAEYAQANITGDYSINRSALMYDTYQPSVVAIESNSVGKWAIEGFIKARSSANVVGVHTNQNSKRINTDRLKLLVENHQLSYAPDSAIVLQLKNFRQNERGQRSAASGFHDDHVMCAAIAFAVLDEAKPRGADLMGRGVL